MSAIAFTQKNIEFSSSECEETTEREICVVCRSYVRTNNGSYSQYPFEAITFLNNRRRTN